MNALRPTTCLTLATGLGLTTFANSVEAQIIYSGPVNIQIPGNSIGVYINLVTGTTGITAGAVPGWDIRPFTLSGVALAWSGTAVDGETGFVRGGGSTTRVDNLALGTLVGASSPGTPGYTTTSNGPCESTGAFAFVFNSSNNYVGFRFLNESTGTVNYGWLQLFLGPSYTDPSRAIIGYAYETSGGGIAVGDVGSVPEPGTYFAGLAAGAVALRAWRRRKAQGQAARTDH